MQNINISPKSYIQYESWLVMTQEWEAFAFDVPKAWATSASRKSKSSGLTIGASVCSCQTIFRAMV